MARKGTGAAASKGTPGQEKMALLLNDRFEETINVPVNGFDTRDLPRSLSEAQNYKTVNIEERGDVENGRIWLGFNKIKITFVKG